MSPESAFEIPAQILNTAFPVFGFASSVTTFGTGTATGVGCRCLAAGSRTRSNLLHKLNEQDTFCRGHKPVCELDELERYNVGYQQDDKTAAPTNFNNDSSNSNIVPATHQYHRNGFPKAAARIPLLSLYSRKHHPVIDDWRAKGKQ